MNLGCGRAESSYAFWTNRGWSGLVVGLLPVHLLSAFRGFLGGSLLLLFVVAPGASIVLPFFSNGYLDTLIGEAFAQRRAFTDSREFLCRVDLEWLAVTLRENRNLARIDLERIAGLHIACGIWHTDAGKGETQSG